MLQDDESIGEFVECLRRRDKGRGMLRSRSATVLPISKALESVPVQTKWIMTPTGANAVETVQDISRVEVTDDNQTIGSQGESNLQSATASSLVLNPAVDRRQRGLKRWNTFG